MTVLNLVLISATPSLIPATLCNIGEFKNSLRLKWFGFFLLGWGARPVNPVYRAWLLKDLCWCNGAGGSQPALWGQAGVEEQQDSSEPGQMPSEEFTWKAIAVAHPYFLPLFLLHGGSWFL